MFAGALNEKLKLAGYFRNNLLEPMSIVARHEELVKEMESRGYNHQSPLPEPDISYLPTEHQKRRINTTESEKELFGRCPNCGVNSGET